MSEYGSIEGLDFVELENRFGRDTARAILRTLERMEGISDAGNPGLSDADRMRNVLAAMRENIRFQTRH